MASSASLLTFAVANRGLRGMSAIAVGVALNVAAIDGNGFMPVSARAAASVGLASNEPPTDYGHRVSKEQTSLWWFGDIIPVPLARQVLSIGDLFLLFGIGRLVFHLTQPVKE